jgi:hypothetical protein
MKTHHQLYEQICSFENLLWAAHRAVTVKRNDEGRMMNDETSGWHRNRRQTVSSFFIHTSSFPGKPVRADIFVEHETNKSTQLRRSDMVAVRKDCRPAGTVSLAHRMGEGGRRPGEGRWGKAFLGGGTEVRCRILTTKKLR